MLLFVEFDNEFEKLRTRVDKCDQTDRENQNAQLAPTEIGDIGKNGWNSSAIGMARRGGGRSTGG